MVNKRVILNLSAGAGHFQHEVLKDKTLSGNILTFIINGGMIFMLALVGAALDDPIIYPVVVFILIIAAGIQLVTLISLCWVLKNRIKDKG